jgi:hypothetical protein
LENGAFFFFKLQRHIPKTRQASTAHRYASASISNIARTQYTAVAYGFFVFLLPTHAMQDPHPGRVCAPSN